MTVRTIRQPIVQTKKKWSDPWQMRYFLEPVEASSCVGPTIPTAKFRWRYGDIKSSDAVTFGERFWLPVEGEFVRIARHPTADEWADEPDEPGMVTVWLGIITSEAETPGDATPAAEADVGDQVFPARGLGALLQRCQLDRSFCYIYLPEELRGVHEIHDILPWNFADSKEGIVGNRSIGQYPTGSSRASYVFSGQAEGRAVWNAKQILEYLLLRFGPGGLEWQLAGTEELLASLETIKPAVRPAKTVAGVINQLIDRRRGLCWWVPPAAEQPMIYVDTIFRETIKISGGDFAGNQSGANIDGDMEAVQGLQILKSSEHRYDRIIARGGPLVICGTATLTKGWTGRLEYEEAGSGTPGYAGLSHLEKEKLNERIRQQDKFKDVYRTYLPSVDGAGLNFDESWIGRCQDDGKIDWTQSYGAPFLGRRYLGHTPLRSGVDYTTDPPTDLADIPGDFLPPVAFGTAHKDGATVKMQLDRLAEVFDKVPSVGLRVLENRMGLHLVAKPNHIVAYGDFDASEPSRWPAVVDNIFFRYAVALPEHLQVVKKMETFKAGENPRTLLIEVPGCECWTLDAETILGVGADGEYVKSPSYSPAKPKMELRNDRDKLQMVADLAHEWYSRQRRAIAIRWAEPVFDFSVGTILRDLTLQGTTMECNSLITRIVWNFDDMTTTLTSDFGELDFVRTARVSALGGPSLGDGGGNHFATTRRRGNPAVRDVGGGAVPQPDGTARYQCLTWDRSDGQTYESWGPRWHYLHE